MNIRDYDYVEARLLAPATEALDAVERLRQIGEKDLADRVMVVAVKLTEECREVRRGLGLRGAE